MMAAAEERHRRRRVRRVLIFTATALATILVVGFMALLLATRSFVASGEIAPNVSIAGLDVAGMTREEALSALRTQWLPSLPDAVRVTFPGGEWDARREELGVRLGLEAAVDDALKVGREGGLMAQLTARIRLIDNPVRVEVPVEVDEATLEDAVGGLAETVDRDPVDADFEIAGREVNIIPGQVGRLLNIDATMAAIRSALSEPSAEQVEAVVEVRQPAVTEEDLAHIEVVLAEYSTPYNPARRDRSHNLRLAVSKLNEVVIRPGEEFSFNQTVGERLVEAGYREAPIFINGEVKPSTGGGVCQIASTTYNVALLANLDMIERHHHSRPVDYVPTGRDATVYWGQYDLKFRNSLKHPVVILGEVGSSTVTLRMVGSREDDADVEIVREGLSRIPHDTKEIEDPELDEGETEVEKKGRDGWRVTVYRKATRGDKVIRSEKLHTDYYAPQTEIVRVGTRPLEEELEEGPPTPPEPGALPPPGEAAPGEADAPDAGGRTPADAPPPPGDRLAPDVP